MNVSVQAQQAYAPTQFPVRTPRSIEAQLVGRITAKLQSTLNSNVNFSALATAIHENRQMWDTLAISVLDVENELPDIVKAQIFYLSEFTNAHSRLVLKGEDDVQPLIDVNTAILRGLSGEGSKK